MSDPEDDERERQSAMRLKHVIAKVNKSPSELVTENNLLQQKIKTAMTAFNEILDDLEADESRTDLIAEICKEALVEIK